MHRFILPLLLIAVMGAAAWFRSIPFVPARNPDPNHTHADFAVFINNRPMEFNRPEWMSGASTDPNHDNEEGLRKYLHLHDNIGTVIHRHKPGLTLGDFFGTLGLEVTNTCFRLDPANNTCTNDTERWRMFVNGTERTYDVSYVFEDGDQILLSYDSGDADIPMQLQTLTNDACRYSQTCPWRGKPPAENCIADPAVPCVE